LSSYLTLPEISPYSKLDPRRLDNPKETFKHAVAAMRERGATGHISIADIGCANGEFLYYLRSVFPEASLCGFDSEPHFIVLAQSLGFNAKVGDLRNLDCAEQFDFVLCVGTLPIFQNPADALLPLIRLCKPGGYLIGDGLFNRHECEVRVEFCDNSAATGRGKWRADFNQHSRSLVRSVLQNECSSIDFEDIEMVDIPKRANAPHVHVWTFKDETGRRHITNGLNLLLDGTLLVARRRVTPLALSL